MSLKDEIQRDLQRGQEADWPCSVTWCGYTYPASRGSVKTAKVFELGGGQYNVTLAVTIRANSEAVEDGTLFSATTQPSIGNNIVVDGETYSVAEIDDGHGAVTTLGLIDG